MSAEDSIPDKKSTKSPSASAPKARRISTPRPKKTAKAAKVDVEETPAPVVPEPVAPLVAIAPEPVAPEPVASEPDDSDISAPTEDWPDAATTSGGAQAPGEGQKRKRRRRKGKGQNSGNVQQDENAQAGENPETGSQRPQQPRPQHQPFQQQPQQQSPQNQQRPAAKPDLVAKKAWKIFLAEVSEEGVALISDQDARDLSKRCFRLAEIFIEDQNRRR